MVVNDCKTAQEIDQEYNLTPYTSIDCEAATDEITSSIQFRSKALTQDAHQQQFTNNNDETVPYFTDRIKTWLLPQNLGQTYRSTAIKQNVDFMSHRSFMKIIAELPVVGWFLNVAKRLDDDDLDDDDFDATTYQFQMSKSSLFHLVGNSERPLDERWGIAYVTMAQNVRSEIIIWQKTNIMTVLGNLGGQVVAILGISSFLISNFQQFSFDKSALK